MRMCACACVCMWCLCVCFVFNVCVFYVCVYTCMCVCVCVHCACTVPTARHFETHFDGAFVSLFARSLESFLCAELKRALVRLE